MEHINIDISNLTQILNHVFRLYFLLPKYTKRRNCHKLASRNRKKAITMSITCRTKLHIIFQKISLSALLLNKLETSKKNVI